MDQVPTEWVNVKPIRLEIRQHARQHLETKIVLISEAIGSALYDTDLVIETFHEAEGYFVLGLAEGGDSVPVVLDHLGELLIRLEALPF